MSFDYRKLKGRIVEKFGSQEKFASKLGCSTRTLSLKMNGKISWKQDEIIKAINMLELSENDIQEYFFNVKVQNI